MFSDEGGYYIFPNGLIMQWGKVSNVLFDESHLEKVQFPILFPHKVLSVLASTRQAENAGGMRQIYIYDYNQKEATFFPGFTGKVLHCDFFWYAIGY